MVQWEGVDYGASMRASGVKNKPSRAVLPQSVWRQMKRVWFMYPEKML